MDWKEYVGELFLGPDNRLYEVEAYHPERGFRLLEVATTIRRVEVSTDELVARYQYVFGTEAPPMSRTVKNVLDGYGLLDRAVLNLSLGMPVVEMIEVFKRDGFGDYDIYLTIKGAELLCRTERKRHKIQ